MPDHPQSSDSSFNFKQRLMSKKKSSGGSQQSMSTQPMTKPKKTKKRKSNSVNFGISRPTRSQMSMETIPFDYDKDSARLNKGLRPYTVKPRRYR